MITCEQYDRLGVSKTTGRNRKLDFYPVYKRDCVMYRYKDAPAMTVTEVTDSDRLYEPFLMDVNQLIEVIASFDGSLPWTTDMKLDAEEEDIDYVEGVVYTALASLGHSAEFVIEHQFGRYWVLSIVSGDGNDIP